MIELIVKGRNVSLYKDTSIVIEMNNPLISTQDIAGSFSYSFTIPAAPNDEILDYANLVCVNKTKKYECILRVGEYYNIIGELYILKSTRTCYEISVVFNPIDDKHKKKKLTNFDTSDYDIKISHNYKTHKEKFISFLNETLAEHSNIKFAPFIDEEIYGGKNDDFAQWGNINLSPIVNRVLLDYNEDGKPIVDQNEDSTPNSGFIFTKLFNEVIIKTIEDGKTKYQCNQFTFCPQMKLRWVLDVLCEKVGYKLLTNIERERLENFYLQSLRCMDGSIAQFGFNQFDAHATAQNGDIVHLATFNEKKLYYLDSGEMGLHVTNDPYNIIDDNYIQPITTSQLEVIIKIVVHHKYDYNNRTYRKSTGTGYYDQKRDLVIYIGNMDECMECRVYSTYSQNDLDNPFFDSSKIINLKEGDNTLYVTGVNRTNVIGNNFKVYIFYRTTVEWQNTLLDNVHYRTHFESAKYDASIDIKQYTSSDGAGYVNVFAKELKINEHLPDIDFSTFINYMCNSLGLVFYVNANKKQIQIESAKSIQLAQSVDLTNFLIENETEINEITNYKKKIVLKPLLNNKIDEKKIIPFTPYGRGPFPSAQRNGNKITFCKERNKYYISSSEDKSGISYQFDWNEYSGNNTPLIINATSDDTEEIETGAYFATQDRVKTGNTSVLMAEIKTPGTSPMFGEDNDRFDKVILVYHRGIKNCAEGSFEDIKPVCIDDESDKYCITPDDFGKDFLLPKYELSSKRENITNKFLVPISKVQEILCLFETQDVLPEFQIRKISVNNSILIPLQIKMQFNIDSNNVLVEIDSAKEI